MYVQLTKAVRRYIRCIQQRICSDVPPVQRRLHSFLKGGIETQAITEIAGEFGSGKSQICYTLCVTANTPLDRKGLGGNVIFIDTENTFRSERIFQIAEYRGVSPDEILRRIYVCKIYNTSHLEMIIQDLGKSIEEYKAKLVIASLHFTGPNLLVGEHWLSRHHGSISCCTN